MFPNIKIIVQDLPNVVQRGRSSLPNDAWAKRIEFLPHDFFTPEQTRGDAYLLRQILHDWTDDDARKIVKNLMPAFRANTHLLVLDIVLPDPHTTSPYVERLLRAYDVSMFSIFSSKERTVEQIRPLVESCDSRLQFEGIHCPPGSATSLLS
jgi:6-hydroxytryprostatin B O-methyltransferase